MGVGGFRVPGIRVQGFGSFRDRGSGFWEFQGLGSKVSAIWVKGFRK